MVETRRTYKDLLFRSLFLDTDRLLSLYNALLHTHLKDGRAIDIKTLENVLVSDMRNDLAFQAEDKLLIFIEHQSTINSNIAVRMLLYVIKCYQNLLTEKALYQNKKLLLPAPYCYVFYNGREPLEEAEQHLSDHFLERTDTLNLKIHLIDINYDKKNALLQKCKPLRDYAYFVHRVRENLKQGMTRDDAIRETMRYCMERDVLKDFLQANMKEVFDMVALEWNWNTALDVAKEEAREQGMQQNAENTAILMLEEKEELSKIARFTRLPMERIRELGRLHSLL